MKNCDLASCRYNKDGKCENEEKRSECVEVAELVLRITEVEMRVIETIRAIAEGKKVPPLPIKTVKEFEKWHKGWKPIEQVKEIGKSQEKIDVANFESDWRNNAVYLEDDCK